VSKLADRFDREEAVDDLSAISDIRALLWSLVLRPHRVPPSSGTRKQFFDLRMELENETDVEVVR
jgi:hypothetical protein